MKEKLTRREQQVMDVVYNESPCTVQEVQQAIGASYAAARAALARLVDKNIVKHDYDGPRYVYVPVKDLSSTRALALKDLISTFFKGSSVDAMGELLAMSKDQIDDQQLARLEAMIRKARKEQGK